MERLEAQVVHLNEQLSAKQQQIASLRQRQTTVGPELASTQADLREAERIADELAGAPHPDLPAARAAFESADATFRALLEEHRKRYLFPKTASFESIESLTPTEVVDGWKLVKLWQRDAVPWETLDAGDDRQALEAELTALADAADAVGDALTAESVFQLARGNAERAGASLDGVAHGDVPPPELESLETPLAGASVMHRLLVLLGEPPSASPWPVDERHVRAHAEPRLEAWAARVLGPSRLSELGLCALDVVYAGPGGFDGALAEIERLVGPVDDDVDGGPSLVETLEVASSLRRLFEGGRAVTDADLAHPSRAAATGVDTAELKRRADAVVDALRATRERLEAAPGEEALAACAHFGVVDADPDGALRELRRREAAAAAAADDVARIQSALGDSFRVLPLVRAPFESDDGLLAGDALAPATWLQRAARVRPGAARLHDVHLYAAALDALDAGRLRVAQLPHEPGERWVGLAGGAPPDGRVSIVAALPLGDAGAALAGLHVDEWSEVVPAERQVTGAVFHFDAPAARAPQAVLLAVAPGTEERWELETVEATLLETLELAKLRAVHPAALAEVGGLTRALPALLFGLNLANDTVSTDFKTPR